MGDWIIVLFAIPLGLSPLAMMWAYLKGFEDGEAKTTRQCITLLRRMEEAGNE